jgi:hypothetical protein
MGRKIVRILVWLGVAILQLISTQVVTFILSLFLPGMGDFPQTQPILFVFLLGITYSIGVFLVGWLAIKLGWLKVEPRLPLQLIFTLAGAYLPLVVALFFCHPLEPGNPFFFIAILTSVIGFHLPTWWNGK